MMSHMSRGRGIGFGIFGLSFQKQIVERGLHSLKGGVECSSGVGIISAS